MRLFGKKEKSRADDGKFGFKFVVCLSYAISKLSKDEWRANEYGNGSCSTSDGQWTFICGFMGIFGCHTE